MATRISVDKLQNSVIEDPNSRVILTVTQTLGLSTASVERYDDLSDTPATKLGSEGKVVVVSDDATEHEYSAVTELPDIIAINDKNTAQDGRLDSLEANDTTQDGRLDALELNDATQDGRLDALETNDSTQDTRLDNIETKNSDQDTRLTDIEAKDVEQDDRLDIIEAKDVEQDGRLDVVESVNGTQNTRLDNLETNDTTQDGRLDAIELKNTAQDDRMTTIESKDLEQDGRLDGHDTKNTAQDGRLDGHDSDILDLQTNKLDVALKGAPEGLAELNDQGVVPAAQLPSYVDDVVEYPNFASLPNPGESGKIYVTLDDNLTYRWSGTGYVEISKSLALGETSDTAYRGDRGKVAYDHSQVTSGNPHGVTKAEVGLDQIENLSRSDEFTTDGDNYASRTAIHSLYNDTLARLADKSDITTTVTKDSSVGKAQLPVGTTAEGGAPTKGTIRYDDELGNFVGGNGIVWGAIGGGGGVTWEAITVNTNAMTGKGYLINSPNLVLTLPDDPQPGDTVGIGDYNGQNFGATVTSTKKIMGLDEDFTFDVRNANVVFSFVDDTVGYVLTQGFGENEAPQAIANVARYTNVKDTTVFSFPVITSIYTDVFYNGIKLDRESEYTVDSENSTVTLLEPVKKSTDIIEIYGWNQSLFLNAADIAYDNSTSGLVSGTMQLAIDELSERPNDNLLMNSDFSIWQRGSTQIGHISNSYGSDRWRTVFDTGNANVYRANADNTNLPVFGGARHGIAVDTFTGGVSSYEHTQRIESYLCQNLVSGTVVTVSFGVFTTDGNPVQVAARLWSATNYDDWSSQDNMLSGDIISVGNNGLYVAKFTLPNDDFLQGVQLGIGVYEINSGQTVAIYNAKLEHGNQVTRYQVDNPQVNLANCKRYYVNCSVSHDLNVPGPSDAITSRRGTVYLPVEMRAAPVVTVKQNKETVTATDISTQGFRLRAEGVGSSEWAYTNGYTADAEL